MVNSIGAAGSANMWHLSGAAHSGQMRGKNPFDSVSSLLGMSAGEIATKVKAGSSLDDIATEKGVSHDDLISALKAGAPQEAQGSDRLASMVEHLASQKGGPAGPPPGPPPGGPGGASGVMSGQKTDTQQAMLDSLGELLDMSSNDLENSLRSGTSLVDLLDKKGVSLSNLADSLQSGFLVDQRL